MTLEVSQLFRPPTCALPPDASPALKGPILAIFPQSCPPTAANIVLQALLFILAKPPFCGFPGLFGLVLSQDGQKHGEAPALVIVTGMNWVSQRQHTEHVNLGILKEAAGVTQFLLLHSQAVFVGRARWELPGNKGGASEEPQISNSAPAMSGSLPSVCSPRFSAQE